MFRRMENQGIWARSTFHGWELRSLGGLERMELRALQRFGRRGLNPSPRSRRLYRPAGFIGSTDGASVLPGSPKNETESSYRYTAPGSVLPGGSGSTDAGSVEPASTENQTESSYRYFRPSVGCTGGFSRFWKYLGSKERSWVERNMDM
jgi:hypothetical protein